MRVPRQRRDNEGVSALSSRVAAPMMVLLFGVVEKEEAAVDDGSVMFAVRMDDTNPASFTMFSPSVQVWCPSNCRAHVHAPEG